MTYEFLLIAKRWDDNYERNHTYREFANAKDIKHIAEKFVVANKYVYISKSDVWDEERLKQSVDTVKRDTNGEPMFNADGTPQITKFFYKANIETLDSFKRFVKDADSYEIEIGNDNRYRPAREFLRVKKKVRFEGFVIRFENIDELLEFISWQGIDGIYGEYHYGMDNSLVKDVDGNKMMVIILEI